MDIKQFVNSIYNSNTFVVYEGNEAIIIDLGDFKPIKHFLSENNLNPKAVFITHTHYDHIYGVKEFMESYPEIPVYTSKEGKESFNNPKWNFSRYHDDPISINSDKIMPLKDGDKIEVFPNYTLETIATPGHDHSCLSFKILNNIFTGDSYIPGIKVVDNFPKSDKSLAQEWYTKLELLSHNNNIYPGHCDPQFPES